MERDVWHQWARHIFIMTKQTTPQEQGKQAYPESLHIARPAPPTHAFLNIPSASSSSSYCLLSLTPTSFLIHECMNTHKQADIITTYTLAHIQNGTYMHTEKSSITYEMCEGFK